MKKKTGIYFSNKIEQLFRHGYSLQVYRLNHFSVRLTYEENKKEFFDWFYTTGTLMYGMKTKGYPVTKRIAMVHDDPEECAIFINKELTKHI